MGTGTVVRSSVSLDPSSILCVTMTTVNKNTHMQVQPHTHAHSYIHTYTHNMHTCMRTHTEKQTHKHTNTHIVPYMNKLTRLDSRSSFSPILLLIDT